MATGDLTKVNNLMLLNKTYQARQRELRAEAETIITDFQNRVVKSVPPDKARLIVLQTELKALDKKIRDNCTTLDVLLAQISLDETYFNSVSSFLLKSASFVDENLTSYSEIAVRGETLALVIQFANRGTFYSWTTEANISLRLSFYSSNGTFLVAHDEALVIDEETELNIPGDASVNGDYGLIKTWSFNLTTPICADNLIVVMAIVDNIDGEETIFDRSYTCHVTLLPVVFDADTSLDGIASVTASGFCICLAAASLEGVGTVDATGIRIQPSSAELSSLADVMAIGLPIAISSANVTGAGSLVGSGLQETFASISLDGLASETVIGERVVLGIAELTGVESVVAIGEYVLIGAVELTGVESVAAVGEYVLIGAAELTGADDFDDIEATVETP